MSLLSICQDAADEIGIQHPRSIVSNSAPDAQKLLRYANKVGGKLMRAVAWQVLRKECTATALSSEAQLNLVPSDFDRFIPETFWDRTNKRLLVGPVSAVEWQGLKAVSYDDVSNRRFIHRGGIVYVIPTFDGGESLAFEYVNKEWATNGGGTAQREFLADGDSTSLSEDLITYGVIYEYLRGEGLPYQMAQMDYEAQFNILLENDQPNAEILMAGDIFGHGRRFSGAPPVNACPL